ncbi:SHIRT domain-containing protein, partial [Lagierella massiliensis]|uniref:SHIRT domain-containing protein n=1 Tax=Lagierella massiliensis TaxID=1689303 RepID=UPI000AE659D3
HVVGTWKFTKDEEPQPTEYKVTHEFKSGTTGKELPDEVKALLPENQTGKVDGEKVTPTQPEKTEVPVEGGKWIFKNYDRTEATINGADEKFVGTWEFIKDEEPQPTEYKVTHEFKSGTKDKDLPKEVLALLPKDQEGKKDGEKVTPTQPEKTEVPVEGGKWVFKNYDKAEATIDKANEHFVGTWVFEENKPDPATEYKVTHEFKSGTPGKELPDEVKALLPESQTGKVDGNTVVPTEPTQKEVTTAEGTWTFKGYDRTEATINGADEHFVGTWEFTAKEDPKPETGSVYVKYVAEDGTVLEEEKEVLVNAEVGTP